MEGIVIQMARGIYGWKEKAQEGGTGLDVN